jgi:preprotein translocase subunit SecE
MHVIRPEGRFLESNYHSMSNFIDYLKETKDEVSHVSWPTHKQAITYTALVIGISVVVAVLLAVFDYVFGLGLDWFIT